MAGSLLRRSVSHCGSNKLHPLLRDTCTLWVLGDNRNQSKDSRFNQDQPGHGFVPIENVVGRAFVITWPLDRFGLLEFHHEVFVSVPDP